MENYNLTNSFQMLKIKIYISIRRYIAIPVTFWEHHLWRVTPWLIL